MVEFEPAIKSLTEAEVEFVIVGGVAISVHSSGYVTKDLDFCYRRTTENLKKIISAFARFNPRLRGFPKELPFVWDERTLLNGTNFTLETMIGEIDMLGEFQALAILKPLKKNQFRQNSTAAKFAF